MNTIFKIISSGFILLILLSLVMIITGCSSSIEATGGIRV
jgi:hypothetical protein